MITNPTVCDTFLWGRGHAARVPTTPGAKAKAKLGFVLIPTFTQRFKKFYLGPSQNSLNHLEMNFSKILSTLLYFILFPGKTSIVNTFKSKPLFRHTTASKTKVRVK